MECYRAYSGNLFPFGEKQQTVGGIWQGAGFGKSGYTRKCNGTFLVSFGGRCFYSSGLVLHQEEDSKVKSLKHLTDIYFQSVGYNSVLLLNIPPDRRGLINEADVTRLKEFAEYRKQAFADEG